MSGEPEQMGLAVRVTWGTNTKLLKASTSNLEIALSSVAYAAELRFLSLFLRVCVWQALLIHPALTSEQEVSGKIHKALKC